jgi:membrane-associated phospholipid phosphatase
MTKNTEPVAKAGNYRLYITSFIIAILIFGVMAVIASSGKPTGWEYRLFTAINNWPDSWRGFFSVVTFFGSIWAAAAAVVIAFGAKFYRLSWRLAVTIIGAYGVAFLGKQFIGRVRPMELLGNIHVRAAESGMGFPSGHATIATVIALTVWPYLPRKARYVIVPLFIGLIALSRIYLGVHFPLDVLGGIAVGVASVSFIRVLPQSFRKLIRVS